MTKQEAIKMFGGVPALAHALGVTRHAIYQWPDTLDMARADRVLGAYQRIGGSKKRQRQSKAA